MAVKVIELHHHGIRGGPSRADVDTALAFYHDGPESQQIFMHDPFGNTIELHQAGTCRCVTAARTGAGRMR
jgi:hypothetical protein